MTTTAPLRRKPAITSPYGYSSGSEILSSSGGQRFATPVSTLFRKTCLAAQVGKFVAQDRGAFELERLRGLEHLSLDLPHGGMDVVGNAGFRDDRLLHGGGRLAQGEPERSWNFLIGGNQPARKWLKDRRGRTLSPADILHYERILRALDLTAEIMAEIDGAK